MADTNIEPTSVTAGDTVRWRRALADYPAGAGWTLTYRFVSAAASITVTASADGDTHAVTVSAATTATWSAGAYDWQARASRAGEVYTVATGRLQVLPAFGAAPFDARSSARRQLAIVEAALEASAGEDIVEYEAGGRRVKRNRDQVIADLYRLRAEVARDDAAAAVAAGQPDRRRIFVRFGA